MIYAIFGGAVAVLVMLGLASAWAQRRRWLRWALVALAVAAIPAAYVGALDLLSRPKPASHELLLYRTSKAEVKGYHAIAGVGLYLLLYAPEWPEPRYFSYPWNEETRQMIKQLQDAWASAQRHGEPVFMYDPFEPSLETEKPIFDHPPPQLRLPPKQEPPRPKKYEV